LLTGLALFGADQLQRGETNFAATSRLYGLKAIELLEVGQTPTAQTNGAQWEKTKSKWLLPLYQSVAVLAAHAGDFSDAEVKLRKAVELEKKDPLNYWLLATIKNNQYAQDAAKYRSANSSAEQEEMLARINVELDEIIDLYARVVALSEGKAEFKQFYDPALSNLELYYRFRRKDSAEGMRKLIEKYKVEIN
jgi:hypothetical protein